MTDNKSNRVPFDSLHAELAAIDAAFHGWHAFIGTGRDASVWAVTTTALYGIGSGTTLNAPTPALMRTAIAEHEHRLAAGARRAA